MIFRTGVHLDKAKIIGELKTALLTAEEWKAGPDMWFTLEDAFFGGECQECFWEVRRLPADNTRLRIWIFLA